MDILLNHKTINNPSILCDNLLAFYGETEPSMLAQFVKLARTSSEIKVTRLPPFYRMKIGWEMTETN